MMKKKGIFMPTCRNIIYSNEYCKVEFGNKGIKGFSLKICSLCALLSFWFLSLLCPSFAVFPSFLLMFLTPCISAFLYLSPVKWDF